MASASAKKKTKAYDFTLPPTERERWRRSLVSGKAWLPPMRESSSSVCVDGMVYVFGGVGCGGEGGRYAQVVAFDPDDDTWMSVDTSGGAPATRSRHSATAVGPYMFVYGGESNFHRKSIASIDEMKRRRTVFGDMYRFDTRTATWTLIQATTRKAPSRRRGHSAVLRVDSETGPEIVVFGGTGPNPEETRDIPLGDTWAYRIDSNVWVQYETNGEAPPPRSSHAAILCNHKMWVFGGMGGRGILGDLYCLSFDTLKWTRIDTAPASSSSRAPAATPTNVPCARYGARLVQNPWYLPRFVLFGGRSYRETPDAAVYEFDTESLRWRNVRAVDAPPAPRYGHAMVPLFLTPSQVAYKIWRGENPEAGDESPRMPVSVPKGAPHVKRPRRTSNFGLFASTATRRMVKPDRNAIERNRFAAAKLRKKKAAVDAHDPLALARAEEARKYKTVIVLGGARTDGGGFCSPEAVYRLLCAPPPFVADDESVTVPTDQGDGEELDALAELQSSTRLSGGASAAGTPKHLSRASRRASRRSHGSNMRGSRGSRLSTRRSLGAGFATDAYADTLQLGGSRLDADEPVTVPTSYQHFRTLTQSKRLPPTNVGAGMPSFSGMSLDNSQVWASIGGESQSTVRGRHSAMSPGGFRGGRRSHARRGRAATAQANLSSTFSGGVQAEPSEYSLAQFFAHMNESASTVPSSPAGRRTTATGGLIPLTTAHMAYVPPASAPGVRKPTHLRALDAPMAMDATVRRRSPAPHAVMPRRRTDRRSRTASARSRATTAPSGSRTHRHMARVLGIKFDRPKPTPGPAPGTPGAPPPARPTIVHPKLADPPPTAIRPLRSPSLAGVREVFRASPPPKMAYDRALELSMSAPTIPKVLHPSNRIKVVPPTVSSFAPPPMRAQHMLFSPIAASKFA